MALIAFCAVLHGNPGANAAVISRQNGDVLVSNEKGFAPVSREATLAPGGRVLVRPGGLALIMYEGNCTVRVGPGFWLVQNGRPCREGETTIDFTQRMNQEAPPAGPLEIDPLVVGGIVAAGALGLGVYLSSQNNNDAPASP